MSGAYDPPSATTPGPDGSAAAPLRDVTVIETAAYVSGPFAGLMLAQLGARVIKVEPPRGDPARRYGLRHRGLSALWVNVNHGKQSVVLDLRDDGDRQTMLGLLADADVLLQNWRPGVAESLGLGHATLESVNPRLINVAITGFGDSGPRASVPAFDVLIQAAAGLAHYEADDHGPRPARSFVADKVTANIAVQMVLAALFDRTRTGRGSRIDLSMFDALAHFDFPDLGQDRTFLPPAESISLARVRNPLLRTIDGHVAVAPVSRRQIHAALEAVGHPEWKEDLDAVTSTTELATMLLDRLESVTMTSGTAAQWERKFLDHDVPAATVLSLDEHFADAQVEHNALYETADGPAGPVRRVRHPARINGQDLPAIAPAPAFRPAPGGPPSETR
jgi:crotonobetainyl-CoA:carnitine CoA-transferase CaiB-like acyl-CoA transferase